MIQRNSKKIQNQRNLTLGMKKKMRLGLMRKLIIKLEMKKKGKLKLMKEMNKQMEEMNIQM
jgi:hypothetical protein